MLILASGSPRRKELIEKLGLPFETDVSGNEETVPEGLSVRQVPEYLAGQKARDVFKKRSEKSCRAAGNSEGQKEDFFGGFEADKNGGGEDDIIIGADTIVVCGGEALGKPKTREDAFRMLRKLSGVKHEVITGVSIISACGETSFSSSCLVEFYPLSDEEIERYIDTGEPMDKAGSYGIQGQGALLVKGIKGDYYTVMGLPVAELSRRLDEFCKKMKDII